MESSQITSLREQGWWEFASERSVVNVVHVHVIKNLRSHMDGLVSGFAVIKLTFHFGEFL